MAVVLGIIAAAATVASTAYSIYSGVTQREEAKEAKEEAEQSAYKKAQYEREQARLRLRRLLGAQRTLYAKAGVDVMSGSPLLTLEATEEEAERQMKNISFNLGQSLSQAGRIGERGRAAAIGSYLQGTSTLLSGLGKAGSYYYGLNKKPGASTSAIFNVEEGS